MKIQEGQYVRIKSDRRPEFFQSTGRVVCVCGKRLDTCYVEVGNQTPTYFKSELEPLIIAEMHGGQTNEPD